MSVNLAICASTSQASQAIRPVWKISIVLTILFLAFIASLIDANRLLKSRSIENKQTIALTKKLKLTDIALFTEARYTRHLSQSDTFSAFQDHPLAFDLFPSGSLVAPPQHYAPVFSKSK